MWDVLVLAKDTATRQEFAQSRLRFCRKNVYLICNSSRLEIEIQVFFYCFTYPPPGESVFRVQAFRGKKVIGPYEKDHDLAALASLEAYNQYFQGRTYWNKRDEHSLRKAIGFFNKAAQLDSNMSQAYSGLADCYAALGYGSYESPDSAFLKAEAAALRALQLDTTQADAHTSLGYIRFYYYRDWAGAEKEFTKAIQSDPHYDVAFDSYSYYLTAMGRFQEAGVAIERALEINPMSAQINTDKGFFLYYSGHYEEAVRALKSALGINPKNPLTHLWLGRSLPGNENV